MTTESDRKTKNQTSPTVQWTESLIYQVIAKPMPKTTFMWEDRFVFGPTYGADSGILIEARAYGGELVEGAPVRIDSLWPDTAIADGDLGMNIGGWQYTDANGIAAFPVTYRPDGSLHPEATLKIEGGPIGGGNWPSRSYSVYFKRVPSDPDETTFMATVYPGRPELGEAYAREHLRIYAIAGKYNFGAAGAPPQLSEVHATLFGSGDIAYSYAAGDAALSEASDTITCLINEDYDRGTHTDLFSADFHAVRDLGDTFHFAGARVPVNRDFPERFVTTGNTPFLYAPVRTARIGEPIYLQWPTYTNHQPGEHYTIKHASIVDIQIFPFEFGEVALARLTCDEDFSPVIDLERVVDGKTTVIDRVLLNWLGGDRK